MTSIIITLSLCCTVGIAASASRQLWAFSRDRAIPGWAYLQQVNAKSAVPVLAVCVTTITARLLSLIVLGSSTLFNDVVSLSIVGLFGSYLPWLYSFYSAVCVVTSSYAQALKICSQTSLVHSSYGALADSGSVWNR